MLKNHVEVEMVGYSPLPHEELVESQRPPKNKKNWCFIVPLFFLCLSQSLQWALFIKTAFVVQTPLQQAINIMQSVDKPQFYASITNAENIAKRVDTPQFYVALSSMEDTIVPALEKTLPKLVDHINAPQFYNAFEQLENQVIPEVVKLIPTFNRLPGFLNETQVLIKIAEAILKRWNFTLTEFLEKKIFKNDEQIECGEYGCESEGGECKSEWGCE